MCDEVESFLLGEYILNVFEHVRAVAARSSCVSVIDQFSIGSTEVVVWLVHEKRFGG